MIEIYNVSKTFKNKSTSIHALKNVSIKVEKGDIFGIVGFSGAGKSTLIRLVNLLERPDQGSISIDNQDITKWKGKKLRTIRRDIGMVFQQFNLLTSKTVYQNIAIALRISGVDKKEIVTRVQELLQFVELEDKADTYINKLSGGQKQRVGIARALATNPSILLCDEATSALDPKTTQSILSLLKKVNKEMGVTILLITHEMNVIKDICNKVAVMESGVVIEQGNVVDIFSHPVHQITSGFVKTVINDSIPKSIQKDIIEHGKYSEIMRLKFFGNNAKDAVVSRLNKQYDVDVTILFASVHEMQETILGILILGITGEPKEVERANEYIRSSGVAYEKVVIS